MMASEEKPLEKPEFQKIYAQADARIRDEMLAVNSAFAQKMFVGKLVTNWCPKCRRWRMTYVPKVRLDDPNGIPGGQTFPCTFCNGKLLLVNDSFHTLLSNV